ncbi:hypothetical protein AG1IA_06725 [Rhizoctonia solani AG-1 IA]|uniref:Uncharacterized protein n=1 Tax=Thanatephorus cucumeris (strain AG1-IA) TaxID=983506 RepID=L8WM64_THACA|nr:hypothetical protein AG1IA_06725 [Rhizoctonia solani AG-1 IA]
MTQNRDWRMFPRHARLLSVTLHMHWARSAHRPPRFWIRQSVEQNQRSRCARVGSFGTGADMDKWDGNKHSGYGHECNGRARNVRVRSIWVRIIRVRDEGAWDEWIDRTCGRCELCPTAARHVPTLIGYRLGCQVVRRAAASVYSSLTAGYLGEECCLFVVVPRLL